MATSKLNKEQYANIGSFAGIMLVYNSTNKDGELCLLYTSDAADE